VGQLACYHQAIGIWHRQRLVYHLERQETLQSGAGAEAAAKKRGEDVELATLATARSSCPHRGTSAYFQVTFPGLATN
jgi:uncharacterized protein (DUF427 family)